MHNRNYIRKLTDKDKETLSALKKYMMDNDVTPRAKELAESLGITTTAVQERLLQLERKGEIDLCGNRMGIVVRGMHYVDESDNRGEN